MDSKLFVGVISVFVAIVVLAGALMPVINDAATGEVTIHITNDDSSTLTLQKATSNFALDLSVSTDGDSNIVIANGSDSMTIDPNESFFIVATDSAAIYYDQGIINLVWTDDGTTAQREIDNPFTAVIADNKLTVDDGTATDLPLPTTYMFSPSSAGGYGSFTAPDLNLVPNDPVIAAGTFAGVYCYNANTTIGDSLQEYVTVSDNVLEEVIWALPAPVDDQQIIITPLDPSIFDPLNPIDTDPIIIDPFDPGDNIIMAVPTPTYTDGDWGYDIDNVTNKAKIVSYSGATGGQLVVPSKVNGIDVIQVGKGGIGNTVVNTSSSFTDLIIPEGVTTIGSYAFTTCSGFTGSLSLPDSITSIGDYAFNGCTGFTGSLIIPESVTTIGESSFRECRGFTGSLKLPDNITTISQYAFYYCSGLTGSLIIPEGVTSIGSMAFYYCSGFTGSLIIPEGVTTIGSTAFRYCSNLGDTLVIPASVTSVGSTAFRDCSNIMGLVMFSTATPGNDAFRSTGITEVLNLTDTDMSSTPYLTNAEFRQGDDAYIDAQLFLAPADVAITEGSPSPYGPLLKAIPLLVIMAILMMIVGYTMIRRSY